MLRFTVLRGQKCDPSGPGVCSQQLA